jgi:K+-sensing histidine kinase KdpD
VGAIQTKPPTARRQPQAPSTGPRLRVDPPLAVYMPLLGFLALLGLSTLLDAGRGQVPRAVSLCVFAAAVAGCALLARPASALLLAGCGWLDYDGFVIGQQGTLHWHGSQDAMRMAVLFGSALVVLALRAVRQAQSQRRSA